MDKYNYLSEELLKEFIIDLFFKGMKGEDIEALVQEDGKWIPIRQSRAFDEAMKRDTEKYINGED